MREILYKELEVDSLVYDLKLELCSLYMKGHRCPPEVIKKDSQLRTLLMRATMSNTELTSIFVTKVRKVENLEPTDLSLEVWWGLSFLKQMLWLM